MRIRLILPVAAAVLAAGCTLPPRVVEVMPDSKLCSVHRHPGWHGYRVSEDTRAVVDAERARRNLEPCPPIPAKS